MTSHCQNGNAHSCLFVTFKICFNNTPQTNPKTALNAFFIPVYWPPHDIICESSCLGSPLRPNWPYCFSHYLANFHHFNLQCHYNIIPSATYQLLCSGLYWRQKSYISLTRTQQRGNLFPSSFLFFSPSVICKCETLEEDVYKQSETLMQPLTNSSFNDNTVCWSTWMKCTHTHTNQNWMFWWNTTVSIQTFTWSVRNAHFTLCCRLHGRRRYL